MRELIFASLLSIRVPLQDKLLMQIFVLNPSQPIVPMKVFMFEQLEVWVGEFEQVICVVVVSFVM